MIRNEMSSTISYEKEKREKLYQALFDVVIDFHFNRKEETILSLFNTCTNNISAFKMKSYLGLSAIELLIYQDAKCLGLFLFYIKWSQKKYDQDIKTLGSNLTFAYASRFGD
ncbi:hypothetical protein EI427_22355 [Flammeovirga pectinis]|uniref:Uncharacterized protein n=1 Tax=Flammeovirga pectinis TaxID=2494373 RepID=A0A3S9P9W5_9BACT|nr:hypothetical protein [Flammeovirga pectinis]AZQ64967.1 hypothetical protein EI427_22355 [Flammeovirga pectinis]